MHWGWFRCWILSDASSRFDEPPYAEPHVRWCERATEVTPSPTRFDRDDAAGFAGMSFRCRSGNLLDDKAGEQGFVHAGLVGFVDGAVYFLDDLVGQIMLALQR